MRSLGTGVVKLEPEQTRHLNAVLSIHDPKAAPLSPGMYLYSLSYTDPTNTVECTINLKRIASGLGVHESFWKIFCAFIKEQADEAVRRKDPDSSTFLSGSLEVVDAITDSGISSGIWFSRIRNDVNYRHQYDTWFPIPKQAKSLKALRNVKIVKSASVRMDLDKSKNPITSFVRLAEYLSCLSIEISDLLAARSTRGGTFGQKWRRLTTHLQ